MKKYAVCKNSVDGWGSLGEGPYCGVVDVLYSKEEALDKAATLNNRMAKVYAVKGDSFGDFNDFWVLDEPVEVENPRDMLDMYEVCRLKIDDNRYVLDKLFGLFSKETAEKMHNDDHSLNVSKFRYEDWLTRLIHGVDVD